MTEERPIRILHLADIHLGVESYGPLDPTTGLSGRVGDFLRGLDQAIEEALSGEIDLVLFAGDFYRTRDPNPTHQRELARRIRRLSDAAVPTFLLAGNHDLPAATGRASSVDIFDALTVPHVTVAVRPGLLRVETRRGPVQIFALPWVQRSGLLTREAYRGKTAREVDALIVERVEQIIRASVEGLDPGLPRILAAHASVQGAVWGTERQVMLGQDIVLPRSVVLDPAFDYVALGHIHKHQVLATEPLAIYPGSIDRVDFGEEREEKGYVVAEVWQGGARYRFRPVNARRFLTLDLTAEGADPTARILEAIEAANVEGAVVRVHVHVTPELEPQVDLNRIRAALRGAYYTAAVTKRVERRYRQRLGERLAEELSPLDALEAYLQSRNEPPERIKALLELAEPLTREA